MLEQVFVYSFLIGLVLMAVGAFALVVAGFRTRPAWGIGLLLFPPLALVFVARYPRRSLWPATVLAIGLVATVGPAIYTRFLPVSLGSHKQEVGGEIRLTLTGWDRTDYTVLRSEPEAAVIQMANPDVDDSVVALLAGMKQLRELDLSNTSVTDAGVRSLAALPKLETLRLSKTRLTDAGMTESIMRMPALKRLDVAGTSVSAEALDAWKAAAPGRRGVR
ncbi:MAG: hypothetical protein U0794_07960 [Isosphaeraceae bacterium]